MDKITIGRSSENDVVCNENVVSRQHCELYCSKKKVYIKDLGSSNGTKVNGAKITKPVWLKKGDKVVLGNNVTIDWYKEWTRFYTYDIITEEPLGKTVRIPNDYETHLDDDFTYESHSQPNGNISTPNEKEKPFIEIPSSIHIKQEQDYAEVYKKGDDFQVPFKRKLGDNIGHHVGNTLGCLISALIVAAVIAIIAAIAY